MFHANFFKERFLSPFHRFLSPDQSTVFLVFCSLLAFTVQKAYSYSLAGIIIHPKYEFETCSKCIPSFDVALIVLEVPVDFSDFIQPACLPKQNEKSEGPLTLTGWGNTVAGSRIGETASILQELNVQEVPLDECNTIWKSKLKEDLMASQMCASTGITGSTSCKGDSGGPLVRNSNFLKQIWELAGVVSFGISTCGNADFPLGFTKVEGEVNVWLQEIVGRELPIHPK